MPDKTVLGEMLAFAELMETEDLRAHAALAYLKLARFAYERAEEIGTIAIDAIGQQIDVEERIMKARLGVISTGEVS